MKIDLEVEIKTRDERISEMNVKLDKEIRSRDLLIEIRDEISGERAAKIRSSEIGSHAPHTRTGDGREPAALGRGDLPGVVLNMLEETEKLRVTSRQLTNVLIAEYPEYRGRAWESVRGSVSGTLTVLFQADLVDRVPHGSRGFAYWKRMGA